MALTGERKNPKRIAREIEIFSIFCLDGPHVGPEAQLEESSFLQQNLLIMMID